MDTNFSTSNNGRRQTSEPSPRHEKVVEIDPGRRIQMGDRADANLVQDDESLSLDELTKIWARRAEMLAKKPLVEATGQTIDLLVFWMENERYGLDVTNVREIYPLTQLTPVPRTPNFVAGVFSARGRIISVIDLHAFLGRSPLERSTQTKIVVATNTGTNSETAAMEVGILTDDIEDVITIFKTDIALPLTTQSGAGADYLQGITADMLIVLDLNALLSNKSLIVQEEML